MVAPNWKGLCERLYSWVEMAVSITYVMLFVGILLQLFDFKGWPHERR